MTRCRAGEVLLVEYPFTDQSGSKLRPVLVVSDDAFNQGDDLVVLPISSVTPVSNQYSYPISSTDSCFQGSGLRRSSYVKWTKPITISGRVIKRRLGKLPKHSLSEIQARLRQLFGESS